MNQTAKFAVYARTEGRDNLEFRFSNNMTFLESSWRARCTLENLHPTYVGA
jgi:hypothetical protein